jgi:hypothetical protein
MTVHLVTNHHPPTSRVKSEPLPTVADQTNALQHILDNHRFEHIKLRCRPQCQLLSRLSKAYKPQIDHWHLQR